MEEKKSWKNPIDLHKTDDAERDRRPGAGALESTVWPTGSDIGRCLEDEAHVDDRERAWAPTRARHLSHRMEALWQEALSNNKRARSRLDGEPFGCGQSLGRHAQQNARGELGKSGLPPADAERTTARFASEGRRERFKRKLEAWEARTASGDVPQGPRCASCGAPLTAKASSLCAVCQAGDDATRAWLRDAEARLASPHEGSTAAPRVGGDDWAAAPLDPIDAFSAEVFAQLEPERECGRACQPCIEMAPLSGAEDAGDGGAVQWQCRRLFWLLALLIVCAGIAASVHDFDGPSSRPSQGENRASK